MGSDNPFEIFTVEHAAVERLIREGTVELETTEFIVGEDPELIEVDSEEDTVDDT